MKVLNDARSVQTLQTQNKALEEASDIQAIKQKTGEGTIQEAAQAKADLEQSQASTIAAKAQLAIDKRALYSLTTETTSHTKQPAITSWMWRISISQKILHPH